MRKCIAIVLCVVLGAPVFTQAQTKNSFQDVTSHLDSGGNLYLYLSTEEWLKGLSTQISQFRDFAKSLPGTPPDDRQNGTRTLELLAKLVKESGLEQISGFGMSSIALDGGLYRSKWIIHHYRGNDSGYLWSALGRQPHPLDGLDLLPANTAFAWFSDLDLPLLWSVLNNDIRQSGIPGSDQMIQGIRAQLLAMTGGELDKALASIGNECGIAVTLDDSGTTIFPNIGAMLMCRVKNDMIFNLADAMLKNDRTVIRIDRSDLRMRTIPSSSAVAGPVRQRISIARSGDYLFVASTDELIEAAVAVKAGKKMGLKSTDEFKKVSQGIPQQGNSFMFRSQRIAETVARMQSQFLPTNASTNPGQRQMFAYLFGAPGTAGSYHVAANSPEGWLSVGNNGQNPATAFVLLPTMAVTLLTASVAIPGLFRSQQAANESAAIASLRTIATAEVTHFASSGNYADLRTLIQAGLLDTRFLSTKNGYDLSVNLSGRSYTAAATPATPNNGRYGYSVSTDGVVRYSRVPTLAPPGQAGNPVQ